MTISNLYYRPSLHLGSSRSKKQTEKEPNSNQNISAPSSKVSTTRTSVDNEITKTLEALKQARTMKHGSQKLFQAIQAIESLSSALYSRPASTARANQLECLKNLASYGQSLQGIIDKGQIGQATPRPMEPFEATVIIHMIFDLIHPDKYIAKSAQDNLLALKVPLEKLERLKAKMLEELKPKDSLKFSSQSLQNLIQDSLDTIRQENSIFEVMDKVANHYIQTAESVIPQVLFSAAATDYLYDSPIYDATQRPGWATWPGENEITNRYNAFEWNQHLINRKFQLVELERKTLQQNVASLHETNAAFSESISRAIADGITQGIAQGRAFSQFNRQ
jgi:hypothetical protein